MEIRSTNVNVAVCALNSAVSEASGLPLKNKILSCYLTHILYSKY